MYSDLIMQLEEKTGYRFKDRSLLENAMTHSSYSHELMINKDRQTDNERLEFLGDAVLELISSDLLFKKYPELPEGNLSKMRAGLVSEAPLAFKARRLGINECIRLGKGEKQNHGYERDSILSDALEALIGAIYLDGGIEEAKNFVNTHVLDDEGQEKLFFDAKTELQTLVQNKYQKVPEYEMISEEGPPHLRVYTMRCLVDGKEYGTGSGPSKKSAQQEAAKQALERLNESGLI